MWSIGKIEAMSNNSLVRLNPCFGMTHECDGRTDILIANAALNYVAQAKQ